jgi:hypothetical protein
MAQMKAWSAVLAAIVLVGCSQAKPGEVIPEDTPAIVRVDNMRPFDMTIYVVPSGGGNRERLGVARGSAVTTMTVPGYLTRRNATIRFLADPIGGQSLPISHDINVGPGDEVTMRIEP